MTPTATLPMRNLSSNYDEMSMQQSLLFSDSLKDLKNLRTQLYSAAEYFELAYIHDDQNNIVVDTLKDYAIRALVNTVDHLGSVTYKVNDLLDEKLKAISDTESRVSCIEQRLRTCKEYIDREGIAQQSSVTNAPRYHKRYVLPVGQTMNGSSPANLNYKGYGLDEDDWLQIRTAVRATVRESPSFVRRGRSASPASRPSQLPGSFSFTGTTPKTEKVVDKRSASPHPIPPSHSESLAFRSTTPKSSRPTTPNRARERQRKYIPDSWKSASFRVHDEKEKPKPKEMERHPSKSKRLLKALLSKRKTKKDDTLDTFLDEY
ncbi:hypothetical protein Cgig2_015994 [Carnegiea gigantea]|uniref:Uncharacterized protein n=1 Tax=Carnegiea gigantea TaxID=171969 RepID=A0A9Q1KNW3_9CARY|nr:hypothetical protein Cgig2_015994 [Carnegiea gigantea]